MENEPRNQNSSSDPEYEAPHVERVMDADELAREAHYAGEFLPVPS